MEVVDNIQEQPRKFPRLANGRTSDSNKIGLKGIEKIHPEGEEDKDSKRVGGSAGGVAGEGVGGADDDGNRLRGWHHSRIIRVSRASGGKDRHSKVWTSKGLRDRRVRLSVATAIQFYDLQDRLGFEQPSKAVEWLIKAAADAIAELPSLNTTFPETPKQPSGEKISATDQPGPFDSVEQNQSQLHVSLSKSACSSNSETSKGSGLFLSRSEVRVNRLKARERARERAQKEKEKEQDSSRIAVDHNLTSMTQNSSFTELLAGGAAAVSAHRDAGVAAERQWQSSTVAMDYFSSGILEPSTSRAHHSSGFSEQINLGTSLPQTMSSTPLFSSVSAGDNNAEQLHHFSFVHDGNIVPAATTQPAGGSDYNLNFTISSNLPGYYRGTLQSNSSLLPHLQRFSPVDGSNLPFLFGAATSAAPPLENHHPYQFSPAFDGRLQLCYGGGSRQTEQKGKGKN